jgi:hypothetical protein
MTTFNDIHFIPFGNIVEVDVSENLIFVCYSSITLYGRNNIDKMMFFVVVK